MPVCFSSSSSFFFVLPFSFQSGFASKTGAVAVAVAVELARNPFLVQAMFITSDRKTRKSFNQSILFRQQMTLRSNGRDSRMAFYRPGYLDTAPRIYKYKYILYIFIYMYIQYPVYLGSHFYFVLFQENSKNRRARQSSNHVLLTS